ncbi:MAG: hypothetical protein KAS78_06245, partial [Candidatus Pacebacteria bacterium]|nr:hypothetical protein [Candidatus Paceibacterota bacterium]
TPNQKFAIKMIERLIKKQLPVSKLPSLSQKSYSDKENRPNNTENRRSFYRAKSEHSTSRRNSRSNYQGKRNKLYSR